MFGPILQECRGFLSAYAYDVMHQELALALRILDVSPVELTSSVDDSLEHVKPAFKLFDQDGVCTASQLS